MSDCEQNYHDDESRHTAYSCEEWRRTARYADDHAGEFAEPNPNAPLPLTPADIEALQVEHTKKALDFIYASLNRSNER